MFFTLQLDYPVVVAAIFVSGIGGTFQYGFSISVMTSPSAVSPPKSSEKGKEKPPAAHDTSEITTNLMSDVKQEQIFAIFCENSPKKATVAVDKLV